VNAADLGTLAALAVIACAGAFVFGITGFGSALITIPLASHMLPLPFALALFALLDFSNAWRVGLEYPKLAQKGEIARMLPLVLVGTTIGMTLLVNLPRHAAMVALGVFILAVAVLNLMRGASQSVISQRWAYVAGLGGGLTGSLFGAGGPPYAIYLSRRGLSKEAYRATLGLCSVFSISARVTAFIIAGTLATPKPWLWALVLLPASLTGMWLARRAFNRLSRDLLVRAIGVMLAVSGLSLVIRGLA
jgi:uncharacterized membrane protein YfcA